jgi:hypothetical protein
MHFTPTLSETARSVHHMDNTPSNLNDENLSVPGSLRGEQHLRALRVILFEGPPLDRLIPSEFIAMNDNKSKLRLYLL